jgi:hypothetical protein
MFLLEFSTKIDKMSKNDWKVCLFGQWQSGKLLLTLRGVVDSLMVSLSAF